MTIAPHVGERRLKRGESGACFVAKGEIVMDMSPVFGTSLLMEIVQCLAISLVAAPLLALLKRVVLGNDRLIVTRIV